MVSGGCRCAMLCNANNNSEHPKVVLVSSFSLRYRQFICLPSRIHAQFCHSICLSRFLVSYCIKIDSFMSYLK